LCGSVQGVEQVVQRAGLGDGLHPGHHALVAVRAAQALQTLIVAVDQSRAGLLRPRDELAHALVAPRGVHVNVEDGLWRGLQAHRDGMEAEEDLG
jgi:hypothetical protein